MIEAYAFLAAFTIPILTMSVLLLAWFISYVRLQATSVLYGKKGNPFQTHEGRLRTIGLAVKSSVYSCSVVVVYLSLNFSLGTLDLQRWEPFVLSIFFVITALLASMGFAVPLRRPQSDGLGSGGRLTPWWE